MVRVHPVTRLCRSFPDHLHIHRQEVDRAENGYRQSSTRIPCIGRWRGNAWILCCYASTSSHDHIWREGCVTFEEVLVLLASTGSNGRVLPRAFGDVQLSNFLCTSGVNPYRLLEVGPGHTTPVVTTHSLPCTKVTPLHIIGVNWPLISGGPNHLVQHATALPRLESECHATY